MTETKRKVSHLIKRQGLRGARLDWCVMRQTPQYEPAQVAQSLQVPICKIPLRRVVTYDEERCCKADLT